MKTPESTIVEEIVNDQLDPKGRSHWVVELTFITQNVFDGNDVQKVCGGERMEACRHNPESWTPSLRSSLP